ncbi:MAG: hypothetical protein AUJ11_02030 [Parcubacteria group bacterium CG1_02_44_65]|nr:MAG: hypothetical protein AUJ11_02030 [Parcubacteria group bacterium CG1_02_44_65]
MEKILNFLKSKYFLLFALAILNLLVAFYFLKLSPWSSDSETYLKAMQYLRGANLEQIPYNRLLTTPFMLYSSILASWFTGSFYGGILAVNLIFYFLIIYVFYKLVLEIYQNQTTAVLSSILLLSNYSMYNYGVTYNADLGGWFFFVLGSFFAVKYFNNHGRKRFFYLTILSASTGVLFKEYGALGLISLVMLILFSDFPYKRKVNEILKAGLLFLIMPVLYYIYFYLKFNYSYFNWYLFNINAFAPSYNIILLIKILGWIYLAGWPIFIFGLWQEKKYFEKTRATVLAALLPASLAFLAWPALTQRIAFIIVPWLALISGFGLSKIKNNYIIGTILIAYALINYSITTFLIKIINLPF